MRCAPNQLGLLAARGDDAQAASLLGEQEAAIGERRDRIRQRIEPCLERLDAERVCLAHDRARGNGGLSADLEVRIREVGSFLRDEYREAVDLDGAQSRGPSRHAGLRKSFGDAVRDLVDGVPVPQCCPRARRALRRTFEVRAVANGARLGIWRGERILLRHRRNGR